MCPRGSVWSSGYICKWAGEATPSWEEHDLHTGFLCSSFGSSSVVILHVLDIFGMSSGFMIVVCHSVCAWRAADLLWALSMLHDLVPLQTVTSGTD